MNKNTEITSLSQEILSDITNDRLPLHNILLKAARLSLLLDIPANVDLFKQWAKWAEQNAFVIGSFESSMSAAKDRDVSISSANPVQHVFSPMGNSFERSGVRENTRKASEWMSHYRSETYNFALGIYNKWQFGNIAESIFEKKRAKVQPVLEKVFPDINQRLNSVDLNLNSENPEDWKNAVMSCRSLLMDIADLLNPAKTDEDKPKYINRLKEFVSPRMKSETETSILLSILEETKKRIEYTSDFTQGAAHQERPTKSQAENAVLYTYLIIADLMEIYSERNPTEIKPSPTVAENLT